MSQRTILDVLFPKVRAKLLQVLFTVPVKQRYVRELAFMSRLTSIPFTTSFEALARLDCSPVGRMLTIAFINRIVSTRSIWSCAMSLN